MTTHAAPVPGLYGLMAEFDNPDALVEAARQVTAAGYTKTDAFTPFPVHGLDEALAASDRPVAAIILGGGICGMLGGFGLQYYCQVVSFPINIGGRPYYSWVSWIPPTFEVTILIAAISAFVSVIALNGLPKPYHPVFNAPRFQLASQDRFFLLIEAADPKFDMDNTKAFLAGFNPREVVAVDE